MSEPVVSGRTHRSTMRKLLKGPGAKLGVFWIGLLFVVAVLSPFLANSAPLIEISESGLRFPVLASLAPADVVLLSLVALLPPVLYLPFSWRTVVPVAIGLALVVIALAHSFVEPLRVTVYEKYREAGQAEPAVIQVMAPIPFSPSDYLRDEGDTGLLPPGSNTVAVHWFGTEQNGADVLSRMIHATRIALGIGLVATGIALGLGILLGGLMGYFSGVVDLVGMRLVEIFEAVPTLFLLLTFVAFFDRSLYLMMVIIGLTSWPGYARYVRAEFLRLREQEFVQAAKLCGLPTWSILFRHMLPNGIAPIIVAASFGVASAILAESTLSFLGLGLVDDPSWGQMLNQAVQSSEFYWWMALFPGGAIFLTVLAYNLVGDALRDALDPNLDVLDES